MQRDILFLLPPGFEDNARREYCPECAEMWGVLSYYPAIKESLDIRYVGIRHPRTPICDLLGDGKWNAPTLVLAPDTHPADKVRSKSENGHIFYDSARTIAQYFAYKYGIAMPRGS
ncbi:MAG: DUF3088 family protein [Pseudomonadota bacterium]